MPTTYAPPHLESRSSDQALSVVADAVSQCIADLGGWGRASEHIDRPLSTVHQWGSDLDAWRVRPLLLLARTSPEFGAALIEFIKGAKAPAPEPTAAIPEACETVRVASELIAILVMAVRTGKFPRADMRHVDATIDGLIALLTKLRRDMRAAAR